MNLNQGHTGFHGIAHSCNVTELWNQTDDKRFLGFGTLCLQRKSKNIFNSRQDLVKVQ